MKGCVQDPGSVLLFHLGYLNKILFKKANRYFTHSGLALRVEQLPVMLTLYHKGCQSQQDLAEEIGRDKASIQRTVRFLLNHDYVRIESDPIDGRKNIVHLTEYGNAVSAQILGRIERIDKILFSGIGDKEKSRLIDVIDKLGKKIEKH
jgi:DNA-binding MarR family transcriptional regulator